MTAPDLDALARLAAAAAETIRDHGRTCYRGTGCTAHDHIVTARGLVAAVDALRAERDRRDATEASVAQLRADLERADFERQRVEGERDAIAEATGVFLAAADAHEREATRWQREYIPNHTAHAVVIVAARDVADAARKHLDALLSGAPADVVRAGVVRAYLDAEERWREGIGAYLPGEDVAAYVARRDAERVRVGELHRALVAALAAAEGR